MTEAHVNRGWRWLAYYTSLPGTVETHILSGAIYKPSHVECDVYTKNPEQLVANTTYETRWIYEPEVAGTLNTLPTTYGHAFGLYLYRWWNIWHQASGHGEPMDKLAWRDELGTFGSNFKTLSLAQPETTQNEIGCSNGN